MKKICFLISLLLMAAGSRAQVSQAEFEALVKLYNSSSNIEWKSYCGWTPNLNNVNYDWMGVTVENNTVVGLDLRAIGLAGSLPPEIGNFPYLRELYLGNNPQLSGNFPAELWQLPSLRILNLSNAQAFWPGASMWFVNIPKEIAQLKTLEGLDISYIGFSNPLPDAIGSLKMLRNLNLQGCRLKGPLPSFIQHLTNLEKLTLCENDFSGSLPAWMGQLVNLQQLCIGSENLTGGLPDQMASLKQLQWLELNNALQLNPSFPVIAQLTGLVSLRIFTNRWEGTLPQGLGNLKNLRQLMINNTQISGSLPEDIFSLNRLYTFSFTYSKLSGSLSPKVGQLAELTSLDLRGNQFSGTIPAEIGNLSKLYELRLGRNRFSGDVPESINKIRTLGMLLLEDNELSGLPAITNRLGFRGFENNFFTFEDFEHNLDLLTYNAYAPQKGKFDLLPKQVQITEGQPLRLRLSEPVGGTFNVYEWFKDNQPTGIKTTTPELLKDKITADDAGIYHCVVSNPKLPFLTFRTTTAIVSTLTASPVIDISRSASLYPNPAQQQLRLRLDNELRGSIEIVVIDMMGREWQRENLHKSTQVLEKEMDLRHLPPGLYVVRFVKDNYVGNLRWIKN